MNGIEKITQRLDTETQAEIDRVLDQAKDAAAQAVARYQAQADREAADRKARNEKAAAEREERLVSVAQMEARKVTLGAKQEMVEQAFDLALRKLCEMPDERYIATAAGLLAEAEGAKLALEATTAKVNAIEDVCGTDGAVVLMDMGSAVMTAELAVEECRDEAVRLVDCPIAEGAVLAALVAASGARLDEVVRRAESSRHMEKIVRP